MADTAPDPMARLYDKIDAVAMAQSQTSERLASEVAKSTTEIALARQDIGHLREMIDNHAQAQDKAMGLQRDVLESKIENLRLVNVTEIADIKTVSKAQADRIETLERLRWQLMGACAVLGAIFGAVVKLLPFSR